ncbi:bifunctional tRNA (5-methylaminomethyl-2-thiouridine)(34)-methyltransferase MnmD/FAD-dependent 5-carboxymethylaminomethyl-2-thiouridine(34) oxidoreductase MnmC [Bermanella sp. R86510]|uniref:bifunctional tRNA (5-methylaminomethyl-2-thiouridine)(34)-methyltransferase MnmD/FAD-dependent 5-carboxymethylaminomethyl-2-thiouridine(34) oxidoreductase MnmC n=1 Tax=unclassified Bermanella TaxID=2627862 RepID=UPI0037C75EC6
MIETAKIDWSESTPLSCQFEDFYFSRVSGLEETRYVYIQNNELPHRWIINSPSIFTIAETGFGTGLNFLCTWQLWQKHSTPNQTLHFLSVEKFPFSKADLQRALAHWPELEEQATALLEQYPKLTPGWHQLTMPIQEDSGQVILHLYLGDIHEWLPEIEASVDAWFLDGFSPAKNPDMWQPALFTQMARLSNNRTTVATFTAASMVTRGLQGAGFEISKAKGFGKKREMLKARYLKTTGPTQPNYIVKDSWLCVPHNYSTTRQAVVVGAGIAGCSTAYSLAKRGYHVTIIEQKNDVAQGASGNAQGVIYAKLAAQFTKQSEFYLNGYLHSLRLLEATLGNHSAWDRCGVLQLALSEKEAKRQRKFEQNHQLKTIIERVDANTASDLAGVDIEHGGLWFKDGAWVYPKAWCQALVSHPNIQLKLNTQVLDIGFDKQWQIEISNKQTLLADNLIICSAHQAKNLAPLDFLPTKAMAGQVTQTQQETLNLNMVLCGDSYVTPIHNGKVNFGASYRVNSEQDDIRDEDNQSNLNSLNKNFPSVANQVEGPLHGRASVRCSTPDYIPIVGAVCDYEQFLHDFAPLRKNKKWRFHQAATFLPNLYVNIGHGSRGLSTAPLCAELVAAQINNEPWPMTASAATILSPNRFLVNKISEPVTR